MSARLSRWFCLSLLLVLLAGGIARAQGVVTLTYGSTHLGTLSPEAPLALYVFTGNAGDQIAVRMVGISPGMFPTISLVGPDQLPLADGSPDRFSGAANTTQIAFRLPVAGTYSLVAGGTSGDYLLTLDGRPVDLSIQLPPNTPTEVRLLPEMTGPVYAVAALPTGPQSIQILDTQGSAAFVLTLHDPAGRFVASVDGGLESACLTVPAGNGLYALAIAAADPLVESVFSLTLTAGACLAGGQVAPPAATEEVGPGGACFATSQVNVNIRSGPGINFGVIGALVAGTEIAVTGQTNTGWYRVTGQGIAQGWVAANVVTVSGACTGLPVIAAPVFVPTATSTAILFTTPTATVEASPVATFTATATATETVEAVPSPTATATETVESEPTATATATWTSEPPPEETNDAP